MKYLNIYKQYKNNNKSQEKLNYYSLKNIKHRFSCFKKFP
jgi:hypothetical protein